MREVTRLIEKMTSIAQAILPAPLFYRTLQRDVSSALVMSDQNYDAPCQISPKSTELHWWVDHLTKWNGKSLVKWQGLDIVIESDASLTGWGAMSNGVNTEGPWNAQESCWHINCLEIQTASLAVQTFMKRQSRVSVLLLLDNMTTASYINHLGGTVSPQATQ